MENLIKLTVKTPNQRVDDIQIDCDLQWTVRKLKEYLQDVYPSNPKSSSQKLIYLGKLLQDHLSLKEVFGEWGSQTLHIVCSDVKEAGRDTKTGDITSTAAISYSSVQNAVDTNGVRYRGTAGGCFTSAQLPEQSSTSQNIPSFNLPSSYQLPESMSPSQQQQYQQYMQQYMQYYYQWQMMVSQMSPNQLQHSSFPPFSPPVTPTSSNTPAVGISSSQELSQEQPPQEQPRNQFQNLPMNGGPAPQQGVNDNNIDENPRQRDWLDLVYMSMRGIMLLSIVYFYSSTSRFLMVLLLGCILYLYKTGWFTPQRHDGNPDGEIPNGDVAENLAEVDNRRNSGTNQNDNNDIVNNENDINATSNVNNNNENQNTQQRPSIFRIMWTLFCAFVGSLIPSAPRPIEN